MRKKQFYILLLSATFLALSQLAKADENDPANLFNRPRIVEVLNDDDLLRAKAKNIFGQLNQGWPASFGAIQQSLDEDKNYITITLIKPTKAFDFRSPEDFRRGNFTYTNPSKNKWGHTVVGWQCAPTLKNPARQGMTAMTGESDDQSAQLVKMGWGATAMLTSFLDGKLQTPANLENVFHKVHERGDEMVTTVIEVSEDQCENMLTYLFDFLAHPNSPYKNFGLLPDPEKFEGGGCGSFGEAMIKKARLFPTPITDSFYRTLSIPDHIMGRNQPLGGLKNVIKLYQLPGEQAVHISTLHLINTSWDLKSPDEFHVDLRLVDPEMFLLTLHTLFKAHYSSIKDPIAEQKYSPYNRYVTRYEKTGSANPQYNFIFIDRTFDKQAATIIDDTQNWYADRIKAGYKTRTSTLLDTPVLVMEK